MQIRTTQHESISENQESPSFAIRPRLRLFPILVLLAFFCGGVPSALEHTPGVVGSVVAAPSGPSESGPPIQLEPPAVRAFLVQQLTLVARRDESVFDVLSDDNRLLGTEWTKKALKYEKRDRAFWPRAFPGYHNLRADQLRSLRVIRLDGRVRTTLRRLSGGDEKHPQWQDVSAIFVLARVTIPRLAPQTCYVYLAEGRLYWRPFGW